MPPQPARYWPLEQVEQVVFVQEFDWPPSVDQYCPEPSPVQAVQDPELAPLQPVRNWPTEQVGHWQVLL